MSSLQQVDIEKFLELLRYENMENYNETVIKCYFVHGFPKALHDVIKDKIKKKYIDNNNNHSQSQSEYADFFVSLFKKVLKQESNHFVGSMLLKLLEYWRSVVFKDADTKQTGLTLALYTECQQIATSMQVNGLGQELNNILNRPELFENETYTEIGKKLWPTLITATQNTV